MFADGGVQTGLSDLLTLYAVLSLNPVTLGLWLVALLLIAVRLYWRPISWWWAIGVGIAALLSPAVLIVSMILIVGVA